MKSVVKCLTKNALGEKGKSALGAQVPDLYQRLVGFLDPDLMRSQIVETLATCDSCAMSREHRGPRAKITYEPDLKCCTFDPWVPNFMVGAMLEDPSLSAAGLQAVREKMNSIEECSPLGLRASTKFQRRFLRKDEHEFGNREDWLCPYYDRVQQNCGVWKYRGNVCVSFFCKSNSGARGLAFWSSLGDLLHLIELSVMEECLVQLDFSPRQLSELLPLIDRQTHLERRALPAITPQESRRMWNHYDDPAEFFRKCHRIAQGLTKKDLREILGESGERVLAQVHQRQAKLGARA